MSATTPVARKKNVHKRTKGFRRHQCDRFMRVDSSWRKPRGIDSPQRRRWKSQITLPSVGFGTNTKTRNLLPNGFYKVVVHNAAELEAVMVQNRKYCAEIAHDVGAKLRKELVARAKQLGIVVTNAKARVVESV